jgi:hypothetical protein
MVGGYEKTWLVGLDLIDDPDAAQAPLYSNDVAAMITTARRKCDLLKSSLVISPSYYLFPFVSGNLESNIWIVFQKVDDIKPRNRDSFDQPSFRCSIAGHYNRLQQQIGCNCDRLHTGRYLH